MKSLQCLTTTLYPLLLLLLLLYPHHTQATTPTNTNPSPTPSPQHPQSTSWHPEASTKTPPHPSPHTAPQSPWRAPVPNNAKVPGQGAPLGTWQSTLQHALAQIVHGGAPSADAAAAAYPPERQGHNSEGSLGDLMSQLPGLIKGLGGVDLAGQDDVGEVLATLFADPRAAGIPAWIQALTQGGNKTTGTQSSTRTLQKMTRVGEAPEVQTQALLAQVFSDVSKGLQSLNLSDASSLDDVISAIVNDTGLLTSLSPEAVEMLAALAGASDPGELLQGVTSLDAASTCSADLQSWAAALILQQPWALQVLDATGKLGAGVLTGQRTLMGDYEECVNPLVVGATPAFQAKFCPVGFTPPPALGPIVQYQPMLMHLCVPKSCSLTDLYALVQPTLDALNSQNLGIYCIEHRSPEDDDRFIGVTVMLSVLAFLCAVGTAYGIFWDRRKAKQQKRASSTKGYTNNAYFTTGDTSYQVNGGHVNGKLSNGETPDMVNGSHVNGKPANGEAPNVVNGIHVNGKVSNGEAPDMVNGSHVNGDLTNGEASDMAKGSHVIGDLSNGIYPTAPSGDLVAEGLPGSYVKHDESGEKADLRDMEAGAGGIKPPIVGGPVVSVNGTTIHDSKVADGSNQASAEEGVVSKLLLSFSVLKNGSKVLSCQQNRSDISCLHGIRVLSILWVVLGHAFSMMDPVTGNMVSKAQTMEEISFMVIPAGVLAVDTFFLLSGCLSSFLFLRSTKKSGVTVSGMVLYYIHRYWRLTALYAVLLGVYVGIFPYLKHGPFQYYLGMDSESTCRDYWHYNLLYFNNVVDNSLAKMCFGWSWYLSNDMQFSFLAPLVLIPWAVKRSSRKWRLVGFVLCGAMILTHCITTGVISYREDAAMFSENSEFYMENIYFPPWTRVGPYAVGLLLGYLLFVTPSKHTMDKLSVFLGWTLATGVALTLVYVLHDNLGEITTKGASWNASQAAAYEALGKVLWAACVGWVIFACYTGYGGFVNTLLSWSAWQPLSRLTYGVYLVHIIVMFVLGGNLRKLFYIDNFTATDLFLTSTVLSFLVSFTFSMLVEAPTLGLEKVLLGKIFRAKK